MALSVRLGGAKPRMEHYIIESTTTGSLKVEGSFHYLHAIPLLIAHFVKLHSARTGRPAPGISRKAMRLLYDYKYPGNVRELRNIIERAFVLCSRSTIEPHCLPPEVVYPSDSRAPRAPVTGPLPSERKIALADAISPANHSDTPEARKLRSVLEAHGWNRTATAKELGIGRTTLWRRMKGYGLI